MNGNDLLEFEESNIERLADDFIANNDYLVNKFVCDFWDLFKEHNKEEWDKFVMQEWDNR